MKKTIAVLMGAIALTGACRESLSAPSEDRIVAGTKQPLQNLITGVAAQDRDAVSRFAYLLYPETEARNTVRLDPNEPRFASDLLVGPIDPSNFIGTSGWTTFYAAIRAANQFLADPSAATADWQTLSSGQQAATIGYLQTIKALDYIRLVQLRDTAGVAIQSADPTVTAPLRTKTVVLAYISALLDSANASLTSAGVSASVPFALPAGYSHNGDYSKTANLVKLNRGLKGEVEVYRGFDHQSPCSACFATAITALNVALAGVSATPTASELAMGPYYEYNPSAPESYPNPLVDNHIFLTDNFAQGITAGDARASKIVKASAASASVNGLQLTYRDPITDPGDLSNLTRQIPIARNALFFLLRAQAEAEQGNFVAATAERVGSRRTPCSPTWPPPGRRSCTSTGTPSSTRGRITSSPSANTGRSRGRTSPSPVCRRCRTIRPTARMRCRPRCRFRRARSPVRVAPQPRSPDGQST
jgi:hypothetical protein